MPKSDGQQNSPVGLGKANMAEKCKERDRKHGRVGWEEQGGKGGDIGMEGQAIIASGHQVKGWTWKGKGIFFSDEK